MKVYFMAQNTLSAGPVLVAVMVLCCYCNPFDVFWAMKNRLQIHFYRHSSGLTLMDGRCSGSRAPAVYPVNDHKA